MKALIQAMVAQVLAINSRMAITYENGLLTVGSGLSICATDNETEQRAVLAGVLLGLTAPQTDWRLEDGAGDEEDEVAEGIGHYLARVQETEEVEVEDMNEPQVVLSVLTR